MKLSLFVATLLGLLPFSAYAKTPVEMGVACETAARVVAFSAAASGSYDGDETVSISAEDLKSVALSNVKIIKTSPGKFGKDDPYYTYRANVSVNVDQGTAGGTVELQMTRGGCFVSKASLVAEGNQ